MAETKKEKSTFKWGDQEYLLDDLLKIHAEQEQNYYDFAKTRGQYDTEALSGLRQAIANRINAVKSGKAFSADGVLDSDVVDNTTIQTRKKGLFKKAKYVDQDNTEWAKYYLTKLVGQLKPYQKKDDSAWDINKHGLAAYLTGQGLKAQDIFEQLDLQDEKNPTAARSFNQRKELLKTQLANYKKWLQDKGFDFTKNDSEWDDKFNTDLDEFIKNYDSLDNPSIMASLRKLGAGDDYTTAFTSDKWDLSKDALTAEERKKQQDDKKKSEQAKQKISEFNAAMDNYYNAFSQLGPQKVQMNAYMGEANSSFYRTPEEILEWSKNASTDKLKYGDLYNQDPLNAEAAQYVLPMLQAQGRLKEFTVDGVKYVYDPSKVDRTNHSVIAIDPVTGTMERRFLYDIEEEMADLKNKYFGPQGSAKYHIDIASQKNGGVISMQTGGTFDMNAYLQDLNEKDFERRAKERNITVRELKESERKLKGKETITGGEVGFNANDYVQMATMIGNLGSILLDPVSGGLTGAGLSLVDFANDWNRDGFQWKDAGNLIKNLGMDAIGMVPIIGDAFGTLGKVKKGLLQIAPKAIGYLAMAQGIANSPEIIDSFQKIVDDRDMTTVDWQNISNGLQLIVSGSRVGKHAIKNARAKKAALQKGPDGAAKLQVEVVDGNGKNKMLVLDGEHAKAVRNSDHSETAVNKIIQDIEGFKDYKVVPKFSVSNYKLHMPGTKVTNAVTGSKERRYVPVVSTPAKANISEVYDPTLYKEAYRGGTYSNKAIDNMFSNRVDASGKINSVQAKEANQKVVDQEISELKAAAKKHQESKNKAKERSEKVEEDIKAASKKSEIIEKAKQDIAGVNNDIKTQIGTTISNARKEIERLEASKKPYTSVAEKNIIDSRIKDQYKIILEAKNKIEKAISGVKESKKVSRKTKRVERLLQQLNQDKIKLQNQANAPHSEEFNKLLNYSGKTFVHNGTEYVIKPQATLTEEVLLKEGLFKQGGIININKINKYLNYAKR